MSGIVNQTGARSGVIGTTVGTPPSGATAGNLVLGDSRDFGSSAGDNIVFELASGYDVHVVEFENLSIAADNNNIYLVLGTSSSSFDTTDDYNFSGSFHRYQGTSDTQTTGYIKGKANLCYFYFMANETTHGLSGSIRIYAARNSSLYTSATGHHIYWAQDNYIRNYVWSSSRNVAEDNSHIKIFTSSGNIDSGILKVYGVKK